MRGWGSRHHAACLSAASSCLLPLLLLLLLLLLHSVCSPNHVQQSEAEVHVVNSVKSVYEYGCSTVQLYGYGCTVWQNS